MEPVPTSEYFRTLEEEGLLKARRAGIFKATTTIGRAREIFAADLLRDHLPRRVSIGRGEVIDSRGNNAGELDGLLLDNHRPNFRIGGELYVPAESAIGVIDVKTSLAGRNLTDALGKIARLKSLQRTNHHGFYRTSGVERVPVPPRSPAGFIVAFQGPERTELLERLFNEADEQVRNDYLQYGPEVLAVLGKGAVIKNDGIVFSFDPALAHLEAATTQVSSLQLIIEYVQELLNRFGDLTYEQYSPK
jgi:hypothetical protein